MSPVFRGGTPLAVTLRLAVVMLALLGGCESSRTVCRAGKCTTVTGRAAELPDPSDTGADADGPQPCPLVDETVTCDAKGACIRRKAPTTNCSKDAMVKLLGEAVGLGQAYDDGFRKWAAKNRPAIEAYPGDKARKFVRDYLALIGLRRTKRTIADLQPDVDYLRDYAQRKLGANDADTLAAMNLQAVVQRDSGAFGIAETLFLQTLQMRTVSLGAGSPAVAETNADLGTLYRLTGAYDQARRRHEAALALRRRALGPKHPDTASTMNELGALQLLMHDPARAEPLLLGAKAVLVDRKTEWDVRAGDVMHNLADLYRSTRRYAEAADAYEKSLQYYGIETGGHGNDTRFATAVRDAAGLIVDGHGTMKFSPAEIESFLASALKVFQATLGDDHPDTARTHALMAEMAWRRGDRATSRERMALALKIHEAATAREVLYGSDERRREYLATRSLDPEINFALRDDDTAGRAIGAAAVLQVKGRALDASADALGRARGQLEPRDQALLDELRRVAAQRSTLRLSALDQLDTDASRERLAALARTQEQLERELAARSAGARRALEPVTLAGVQKGLGARDVLVEWVRFHRRDGAIAEGAGPLHYAAFAIAAATPVEVIDLGPAAEIDALIGRWQTGLRDVTSEAASDEARQLHRRVVKPVLDRLARRGVALPERLLLSPDGPLNLVPFAALVDEQGRFLADAHELAYLTSGRDLLRIAAGPGVAPRDGVTVVAAPDYGSAASARGGMVFTALPGTANEAAVIRRLFALDNAHVLTGAAATEARVKQLRGPRILHVATHGFFLQDSAGAGPARGARGVEEGEPELKPTSTTATAAGGADPAATRGGVVDDALLRAGLALAGANARAAGGGEDGILTAAEAARLDLAGTRLVVLSACETGSGAVDGREGVYGLRRALELAGAESQLVSLWKVNDAATARLMELYYGRLKAGDGRAQALRVAQRALRANPATAHPYFWAAFVPIGDWRPLDPS